MFISRLLKQIFVPTQEPYDVNKFLKKDKEGAGGSEDSKDSKDSKKEDQALLE